MANPRRTQIVGQRDAGPARAHSLPGCLHPHPSAPSEDSPPGDPFYRPHLSGNLWIWRRGEGRAVTCPRHSGYTRRTQFCSIAPAFCKRCF